MSLSTKQLDFTHSRIDTVVSLTGVACPLGETQTDKHKPLPCGLFDVASKRFNIRAGYSSLGLSWYSEMNLSR